MSILIDENTRVIVQGITGRDGSFHAGQMMEYGTKIVGGVTPGKGGQETLGVPVFNSVAEAKAEVGADATVIYVPAKFAKGAVQEAIDAEIPLIICITEGVPVNDMVSLYHQVKEKGLTLIGPNCPGLISPGKSKIGIMPGVICSPGKVGVISRSGTLTYEIVYALTNLGIGQSTCVGIGGDPIVGSNFRDILAHFEADPETEAVVLIGEIGGDEEEKTAAYIKENIKTPVFAYIVGASAPEGRTMGHAGAIVSGNVGTAATKQAAFREAGVPVAKTLDEMASMVAEKFGNR
ncbi:MAG: succinate--CoA ligase subunit alpha [Kiritimatiellia bacterium]